MRTARTTGALGVLVSVGLLSGCCLFRGSPTVQIVASTASARIGEAVTFAALATGGSGSYTYQWTGASGQGPIATAIFQSPGERVIAVMVTDSCGRVSQQARAYVNVIDDVLSELTGLWEGELANPGAEPDGEVLEIRVLLFHRGNSLQGNAYHAGRASIGTGSVIGDQVMFEFPFWYDTSRRVVLTGTVDIARDVMRGTWGGSDCATCTWRLVKV